MINSEFYDNPLRRKSFVRGVGQEVINNSYVKYGELSDVEPVAATQEKKVQRRKGKFEEGENDEDNSPKLSFIARDGIIRTHQQELQLKSPEIRP